MISKKKHFKYIFANSKKTGNATVRIYYAKAYGNKGCYAFVATKKIGNAVHRNKCRRRLKEVVRLNNDLISPEYDMIFVANPESGTVIFAQFEKDFKKLLEKSKLYKNQLQ
ncbi:MAG: ribonuclease P protein component [bacterium]|nr:ribonuclease P protein component [bacterium]